jgi:hypothetical protein
MHHPSRNRKPLFILLLIVIGFFFSALAGSILIYFGVVRFDWSERILRRRSIAAAAHKDRRILVIGDSFLTWWPVDHCLYKDLDVWCSARDLGLINTAAGGFGPYEYLDQMRTFSAQYQPNLVLLFYYAGNDLTDVLYRPDDTPRRRDGLAPFVKLAPTPTAMLIRFLDPAATARAEEPADRFDWNKMLERGIAPDLIEKAKNRIKNPNDISPNCVNPHLLDLALNYPRYIVDNILMATPEAQGAWKKGKAQLEDIADLAEKRAADFCIVVIPSTVQVDRSHYEFYRKAAFELDDRLLDSTAPQDHVRSFCKARHIPCIDLLPRFKAAPNKRELYWENDDHLSEAGHVLAFKILSEQYLDAWTNRHPHKSG